MHIPLSNRVMVYSSPNAPLRWAEPRHVSSKHFKPVRTECSPLLVLTCPWMGVSRKPSWFRGRGGFQSDCPTPPADHGVAQAEEPTSHEGWEYEGAAVRGAAHPWGPEPGGTGQLHPQPPALPTPAVRTPKPHGRSMGAPPVQCSCTQVTHPECTEDS